MSDQKRIGLQDGEYGLGHIEVDQAKSIARIVAIAHLGSGWIVDVPLEGVDQPLLESSNATRTIIFEQLALPEEGVEAKAASVRLSRSIQ